MVRRGLSLGYCRFTGERCKIGSFFGIYYTVTIEAFEFEAFVGKMAHFENYSSFHEHESAFWRLECATFRFALIVERNFRISILC